MIDTNLPPRVVSGEEPANLTNDNLRADFSRYTGDQVGNKSTMTMGHVAQALWNRHLPPRQANWAIYAHLLTGTDLSDPGSPGDILAWNSQNNSSVPMRELEVAFAAPDQFDITYYSIEPDFWRNYAVRLQRRFQNLHVRGDLGYRKDAGAPWSTMTVRDQLALARTQNVYNFNVLSYFTGSNRTPASAFVDTLTSWHPTHPGDYKLAAEKFGNCPENAIIPDNPGAVDTAVPGNCFAGGRTGYSVKLIDGEYLRGTNLEFGGRGQTGPLLNAWSEGSLAP